MQHPGSSPNEAVIRAAQEWFPWPFYAFWWAFRSNLWSSVL